MVKASQGGSKKGFYILIAAVAIAGIATLSYMSTRAKPKPIVLDPNLPPVTSQGYVMGSPTAPIEVIEFGDFECPGCNQFAEITEPDVRTQFVNTGKIRFRFIDFPLLNVHRNTLNASVAAACADEQGQFWPMHDVLFAKQDLWNGEATADPDKVIKGLAQSIPALNADTFNQCLDARRTLPKVQSHLNLALARNLRGTPAFIIGGKEYSGMGIDEFSKAVAEATAAADSSAKSAAKAGGKTVAKTKK